MPDATPESNAIAVCLKWVPLSPEIDALTGAVSVDARFRGLSPADEAALEWALRLGERYDLPVNAVTVGPIGAEAILRLALAHGAATAVRLFPSDAEGADRSTVAAALAEACHAATLVLCGNHSLDGGSGAVPAFLSHHLGYGQALGCLGLRLDEQPLVAERRLDQGRRELLAIEGPTVLSFEGGLELRRASLAATMTSDDAAITSRSFSSTPNPALPTATATGPFRPRARVLAGPTGSTVDRIRHLTGAGQEQAAAQQLELEPGPAADAVVEQLRQWGYLSE